MEKRPNDTVFNIFQYHDVFSNALANMLTALVNAEITQNKEDEKKAAAILATLYFWSRAYNNKPCSVSEVEKIRSMDYVDLLSVVIPELKKAGIAPVQASFGESYYSRVISKVEDIEDLLLFLKFKKEYPNFKEKVKEILKEVQKDAAKTE